MIKTLDVSNFRSIQKINCGNAKTVDEIKQNRPNVFFSKLRWACLRQTGGVEIEQEYLFPIIPFLDNQY